MFVDYMALIRKLEDEKWSYIAKYGQAGIKYWPPIEAKLDKLYKWWVKAIQEGKAPPMPPRPTHGKIIKAGTY